MNIQSKKSIANLECVMQFEYIQTKTKRITIFKIRTRIKSCILYMLYLSVRSLSNDFVFPYIYLKN